MNTLTETMSFMDTKNKENMLRERVSQCDQFLEAETQVRAAFQLLRSVLAKLPKSVGFAVLGTPCEGWHHEITCTAISSEITLEAVRRLVDHERMCCERDLSLELIRRPNKKKARAQTIRPA